MEDKTFQVALREVARMTIDNICDKVEALEEPLFANEDLVKQAKQGVEEELMDTFLQEIGGPDDLERKIKDNELPNREYLWLRLIQKLNTLALEKMQEGQALNSRALEKMQGEQKEPVNFEDSTHALQWIQTYFRGGNNVRPGDGGHPLGDQPVDPADSVAST